MKIPVQHYRPEIIKNLKWYSMIKYTTLFDQDTLPTIRGGGRNSMTKKHSWDMIKIKSNTKASEEVVNEGDSINFSQPNSKTGRGRVGVGVAQTLDTQVNQGVVINNEELQLRDGRDNRSCLRSGRNTELGTDGMSIRRLTEIECERLQGYRNVEKCCIFDVCLENQKTNVNVGTQSRRLQKCVGVAGKKNTKETVLSAKKSLSIKEAPISKPAQQNVLINCVGEKVEIFSQERLILSVSVAEIKNTLTLPESFAHLLVLIVTIQEKIMSCGEVELHQNEQMQIQVKSGRMLVKKFGNGIMQPVNGVKSGLTTHKKHTKSTTLARLETENLGMMFQTLFFCVMDAIHSFIPEIIQSNFLLKINVNHGWTAFGNYDGVVKEISRTQRYKLCGNAVTVDVVELIANKLPKEEIVLVSLFSGIDGFAEGLTRASFKISHHYFSEIDKHAIANLKYNFPNAEYIGSVTDVCGASIRAKHPTAKIIITFGWPCQDNSIAGKRKGQTAGTRSGLLFEAGRIIDECRPQTFIAENVKGLFSVNKGIDFYEAIRFLTYLNSDSPQYTVEMQLLNTSWLLPQNRERTYFVGHSSAGGIKRVFPITENDFGSIEGSGNATNVRTLTGGGAFRRDAQLNDVTACVNDNGNIRETEISTAIDANYHKGTDQHGARTMIKTKVPLPAT